MNRPLLLLLAALGAHGFAGCGRSEAPRPTFSASSGGGGEATVLSAPCCPGGKAAGESGPRDPGAGGTVAEPAPPVPSPVDPASAATIEGTVRLVGEPPVLQPIRMDADPVCASLHPGPVEPEDVVLDAGGTLRNALVYIGAGLPKREYPSPADTVVLDQKGCRFVPHVFGIQVRQKLTIRSSDATYHNVHALTRTQAGFNDGMPAAGMELTRTFSRPEVGVKFKCEVHPWMSAYCGIFDHPFFAVTGAGGRFRLPGLPPGSYTVTAWHERYGKIDRQVTVGPGEGRTVDFEFAEE